MAAATVEPSVVVTVNGREYPTELENGVQRFVPDAAVQELVNLSTEAHNGGFGFYDRVPASLKAEAHANPVVNHMVEANEHACYTLNDLVIDLHNGAFELQDWIDFSTLHGYSVDGFLDCVESQLSNLGLGEPYTNEFDDEEYEDYSAHLTFNNPLWD